MKGVAVKLVTVSFVGILWASFLLFLSDDNGPVPAMHSLETSYRYPQLPPICTDQAAQQISIVLPVYPSDQELGLLYNQIRTFERLFDVASIAEILLVSPDLEVWA